MSERILVKGNEALAEAAVRAGCRYYFGYPITPQNEIPAYMSWRLPQLGGEFVQAESEVASINMVYGACATGARAMTSSSSPGVSLMQEGLSYMAGSELPAVVVNMMRGGPGLGNISPSQADYLQSVKGGGHGDYHLVVLAPSTVQEIVDLTVEAFDIAFKYRNPVMIMADGILGQMSEPVVFPPMADVPAYPDWAMGHGGKQVIIRSLFLNPENQLELHNLHLIEKYNRIEKEVRKFEEYQCDDAEILIVAYGTPARIAKSVIGTLRANGVKVGLFRPISLWPFPHKELAAVAQKIAGRGGKIFVPEMAVNQLKQDVDLSVKSLCETIGISKVGGAVFTEEDILSEINKVTGRG